mgnify:CR=1 FL=1|jgi:hypothetical protein|tara:strand:- start:460 stop:657 length:198 start_codon:yes stop_codon:yes gene_type:complete
MSKKLTAKTKKNKPAARPTGYVSVAEHWYDVGYNDAQADAKAKRKKQHEVKVKLMHSGSKENDNE